MSEITQGEIVVGVVGAVLVGWFLVWSGLGRLLLLFGLTVALTAAVEALVYIGLAVALPGVMRGPLAHGLYAWAWLPPLLVAVFVSFYAWREGI